MDLISVHVPRCAGTALRGALVRAYREDRVYFDYGDRLLDPTSRINVDREGYLRQCAAARDSALRGKRVAHGHFCMRKYDGISAARVTILRDPVDRLISHYFFWKHYPRHGHHLHDRFLEEEPTIIEFARMPGLRYFYAQVIFRDVDMRMFDLIGRMEALGKSIASVEKLIGRRLRMERKNGCCGCEYERRREETLGTAHVAAELRDLLKDDIAFYDRHASG
ncbi:MAG: sulfotransferase family 2 domain-containing protein [Tepidisphaeraceae bacterium]|jgi:hypothetical protein